MPERRVRLSLSAQILLGLGLGVVVGLFFGEGASVLQLLADVYIRLMQMTVLPFLALALVIGFGQLDRDTARRLGLRGGGLLVIIWGLTCLVIFAMPLTFWILPLLVTAATPFSYREVIRVSRDAMFTAFVANNAFIVLPILVERAPSGAA